MLYPLFQIFPKKDTLNSKKLGPFLTFIHVMLQRTHDQWVTEGGGGGGEGRNMDERRVQRGAGTVEMKEIRASLVSTTQMV